VAIGMYVITKISENLGVTVSGTSHKMKNVLEKYGLPWELPSMDIAKILNVIGFDKKNSGSDINLIFIKSIGESFIYKVNLKEIEGYFHELGGH
jgi:3-dehydroquinate synthase